MAVVKAPPTFMFPFMMSPFSDADLFLSRTADYIQQAITSPIIKPNSPRLRHLKDKQAIVDVLRRLYDTDNPEPKEGRTLYVWLLESFQQDGACGLCPFFAELNKRRTARRLPPLSDEKRMVATVLLYVLSENHDIKPAHWEGLFSDLIDIEAGDSRIGVLSKSRLPRERVESSNALVDKALLDSVSGERVMLPAPAFDRKGNAKAYISATYVFKSKLQPHDFNVLLTAFNVAMHNREEDDGFVTYWATTEAIAKSYFPNAEKIRDTAIETITDSLKRLADTTFSEIDIEDAVKKGYLPDGFRVPDGVSVPMWTGKPVKIVTGEHTRSRKVKDNGKMVVAKGAEQKIVSGWEITEKPFLFKIAEEWKRIRRIAPNIRPNTIGYDSETEAIYATMSKRVMAIAWNAYRGDMQVSQLLALSDGELSPKQRRTRTETIEKILVHWEAIGLCSVNRFRSKQGVSKSDFGKIGRLEKFEILLPTRNIQTGKRFDAKDAKGEVIDKQWKHKAENQMRSILLEQN